MFEIGDFISQTLVTDTVVYEVIDKTPKTILVRETTSGDVLLREESGNSNFPIVWTEARRFVVGKTYRLRLRKDGTFRISGWANPLRKARLIDGKPARKTDYSF